MKLTSILLIFIMLNFVVEPSISQTNLSNYKSILVFRSLKSGISGRLISLDQNNLNILTTTGDIIINRSEITKIVIRGESKAKEGVGYGMLIGSYASILLLGIRDGSGTFLHNRISEAPYVILLGILPGILVGGAAGYLLDPETEGIEEVFDFTGDNVFSQREWQRLENLFKLPEPDKFHFSVQGSHLYDFNFDNLFFDYQNGSDDFSNFNLVRKLQFTYSILPRLEVGFALTPFGEIGVSRFRWENPTPEQMRSLTLNQKLKSIGYYLVAQYKLTSQSFYERFDLNIGAGMGWMSTNYTRNIEGSVNNFVTYEGSSIGPFPYTNSRSAFSALFYSGITMRLYDGLTIGIVLDRLMVDGLFDPGVPSLGFRAITHNLGTWSFGFNIGVHF